MVNRIITNENFTGFYSHTTKKLELYSKKHVNTGQIIASISLKKLLQQLYVHSQKTPRCYWNWIAHQYHNPICNSTENCILTRHLIESTNQKQQS